MGLGGSFRGGSGRLGASRRPALQARRPKPLPIDARGCNTVRRSDPLRWRAPMRLDDYDTGADIRDLGRTGGGFGGGGGGGMGGLRIGLLPMLLGRTVGCGTIVLLGVSALCVVRHRVVQGRRVTI